MSPSLKQVSAELNKELAGKVCYQVLAGGFDKHTFSVHLRDVLDAESTETAPVIKRDGSNRADVRFGLYVWCAWRLDCGDRAIVSSDGTSDEIAAGLEQLMGMNLTSLTIDTAMWDCVWTFTNGYLLRVFCVHLPDSPSFDGNWEAVTPKRAYEFGPGDVAQVTQRQPSRFDDEKGFGPAPL